MFYWDPLEVTAAEPFSVHVAFIAKWFVCFDQFSNMTLKKNFYSQVICALQSVLEYDLKKA